MRHFTTLLFAIAQASVLQAASPYATLSTFDTNVFALSTNGGKTSLAVRAIRSVGGLDSTGAADSSAAIQRVVNETPYSEVRLPPGDYLVNQTIVITNGCSLVGMHIDPGYSVGNPSRYGVHLISGITDSTPVIWIKEMPGDPYALGPRIYGITIQGNGSEGDGIHVEPTVKETTPVQNVQIENVSVDGVGGYGLYFAWRAPTICRISQVRLFSCHSGGVYYYDYYDIAGGYSTGVTFENVIVNNCVGWGWQLHYSAETVFIGCKDEYSTGGGWFLSHCKRNNFISCRSEGDTPIYIGFVLANSSNQNKFDTCEFVGSVTTSTDTEGLRLMSGLQNTFDNCRFSGANMPLVALYQTGVNGNRFYHSNFTTSTNIYYPNVVVDSNLLAPGNGFWFTATLNPHPVTNEWSNANMVPEYISFNTNNTSVPVLWDLISMRKLSVGTTSDPGLYGALVQGGARIDGGISTKTAAVTNKWILYGTAPEMRITDTASNPYLSLYESGTRGMSIQTVSGTGQIDVGSSKSLYFRNGTDNMLRLTSANADFWKTANFYVGFTAASGVVTNSLTLGTNVLTWSAGDLYWNGTKINP